LYILFIFSALSISEYNQHVLKRTHYMPCALCKPIL